MALAPVRLLSHKLVHHSLGCVFKLKRSKRKRPVASRRRASCNPIAVLGVRQPYMSGSFRDASTPAETFVEAATEEVKTQKRLQKQQRK